jgi:dihydroxy-acid dehydratase
VFNDAGRSKSVDKPVAERNASSVPCSDLPADAGEYYHWYQALFPVPHASVNDLRRCNVKLLKELPSRFFAPVMEGLLQATGKTPEQLDRPAVAIVNSQNEIVPGHIHLNDISASVHDGVLAAGGTPFEFPAIAICDGLTEGHPGMRYPLPSRELIADSIEAMVLAHNFDAMVLVTGCDKITPGMMMAAARLEIPAIVINGGPMLAPRPTAPTQGRRIPTTGCGSCPGLYTANSMACLAEAIGLALPWNGCIPAPHGRRRQLAYETGVRIMRLLEANITPGNVLTREAFENAITVDMAIGGSSNTILHLLALANEANVPLSLDDFDRIGKRTPRLCSIQPSGPYFIEDLYEAGGLQVVMAELAKKDLLHLEAVTLSGLTISQIIDGAKSLRPDVVRSIDSPYYKEGGLAILYGNLAPQGAVVKQSAVKPEMLKHSGPARVFEQEEDAVKAVLGGQINKGEVVVIRYEGPKGGPGFREMLTTTTAIVRSGLDADVALVTDGRFSGATSGAAIGHISPEAAEGGPIAILQEGDIIDIDIPNRRLGVRLSDNTIKGRLAAWKLPPFKGKVKSYLRRYASLVTSANTGAVLKKPER